MGGRTVTYFVFRRTGPDGVLIGAITAANTKLAQRRFDLHPKHQFEVLLETDDWVKAEELIRRGKAIQTLFIDVFEAPYDTGGVGDHTGQVQATWEPDATCTECIDVWRVSASNPTRTPTLDERPIVGAFMVQIDDGLEPMCRRHIEVHDRLSVCTL